MKLKNHMKKIIERIVTVLYIIGLFAFPIYKTFIEPYAKIDGFIDYFAMIPLFLLNFVIWFFIYTPIWALIASLFFPGDVGKEMRESCFAHIALLVIMPLIIIALIKTCDKSDNKDKKKNEIKSGLYSTKPQTDKESVYICTGPQSKRYHRTTYCRGLKSCSDDIEAVDVETAEKKGRTPCGICY